ncbi:hypothetical protein [Erwinia sp. E_sp_W01_6]|uniref:hypothetical protein n=1 Tax=unclassified Erwinia TaxID=2622719 RepID=UPI0030D051F5
MQGTFNASGTIDAYAASSPGISVRFKIVSDDGKRDYVGLSDISVSKSLSCGSSVKSVELGELYQGVNYTAELEITKTGKGQVTFKGSDLLSDGVVHLGGKIRVFWFIPPTKARSALAPPGFPAATEPAFRWLLP